VKAHGYPNSIMPYPTQNTTKAFSAYFHQAVNNACVPQGVPK
jgi:hypothetical protein